MRASRQLLLLAILALIGNLPALLAARSLSSDWGQKILSALIKQAPAFAATAAGAAFSLLGFLVGAMALFSLLGQSQGFIRYRANGYLSVYFLTIAVTMLELGLAFVASLRLFLEHVSADTVGCVVVALVAALGMFAVVMLPAIALQVRHANE